MLASVREEDRIQVHHSKAEDSAATATLELLGHGGEAVNSVRFTPDGRILATGASDKSILLWRVEDGENVGMFNCLHDNAVLDLKFSPYHGGRVLFSASADKTIGVFDCEAQDIIQKLYGHSRIVNSISVSENGPEIIASVSDDGLCKIWDTRNSQGNSVLDLRHRYPMVSVSCFPNVETITNSSETNESSLFAKIVTCGVDNTLRVWDTRKPTQPILELDYGHQDVITSVSLSPTQSNIALTNGADGTLCLWDLSPFSPHGDKGRILASMVTGTPNLDYVIMRGCFSTNGKYFACGLNDRTVCIWDTALATAASAKLKSTQPILKLPGHRATITCVEMYNSVIASSSLDGSVLVGSVSLQ